MYQNFNRFQNAGVYDQGYSKVYLERARPQSFSPPQTQFELEPPTTEKPPVFSDYRTAASNYGAGLVGLPIGVPTRHGQNQQMKKDFFALSQQQQIYRELMAYQQEPQPVEINLSERKALEENLIKSRVDYG